MLSAPTHSRRRPSPTGRRRRRADAGRSWRFAALLLLLTGCAQAQPGADSSNYARRAERPAVTAGDVEQALYRQVDRARTAGDRTPLVRGDTLAAAARAHSTEMAARDFFAHVDPEGRTPEDRARAAGVVCRRGEGDRVRRGVSENLFQTWLYDAVREASDASGRTRRYRWRTPETLAREIVDGWLASPGHRRNLLDPEARTHGLGVAMTDDDRVFVTQVIC